ncbi:MAG TPA: diaminopimelate epimerase, partial [Bacteroidia bacterium]|nr:diaminopimelate epimerase [Bacteroidia bacterium]
TVETDSNFYFLNTGSPHVVVFSEHVSEIDIVKEGRMIRYSDQFKVNGTNVNFIQETNGELFVRTYERGVEEETLSCGTGVTAAVLAAVKKGMLNPDLKSCTVRAPGGTLKVYFLRKNEGFEQVFLEGPATLVYKGSVEV